MVKDIHLKHTFNGDKRVDIVFLIDSIALNSFTVGEMMGVHMMVAFLELSFV